MRFVCGFHFSCWMSNYIIDDTVNEARSGFPLGSYLLPLLCVDNSIRVTVAHSTTMALYSGSSVRNPTFTGHRQIMQLNICIRATCMKYLRFQQKACRIAALTEYPYQRLFLHSALCSHFLIHFFRCKMYYVWVGCKHSQIRKQASSD